MKKKILLLTLISYLPAYTLRGAAEALEKKEIITPQDFADFHTAIEKKDKEKASTLLKKGVTTPQKLLAFNVGGPMRKNLFCIQLALQHGANPNIPFLYKTGHFRNHYLPFGKAIFDNDSDLVTLLLAHGANPFLVLCSDNKTTFEDRETIFDSLTRARTYLAEILFEYMIKKNMFPDNHERFLRYKDEISYEAIKFISGDLPLHLAARYSFASLVKKYCLNNALAKDEQSPYCIEPNTKNSYGQTPLFLCIGNNYRPALEGTVEAAKILLERGADPLEESNGSTPLALARKKICPPLVTQLLQRIAEPSYTNPAAIRHLNERHKGAQHHGPFQKGDTFLHFVASEYCGSTTIMAGLLKKYVRKPTSK